MSSKQSPGGTFTLKGSSHTVNRLGYGAMQLTGPMVWGEPKDRRTAVAVVREAISLGINHIDTSDYYGPHVANQLIREAIHPYPKDLMIVTKVGAKRGPDKSWPKALSPAELTSAIHDNLRNLGLEAIDIVNLRVGEALGANEASIAAPLQTLAGLKKQGLIRHIGLSNISRRQYLESQPITDIVCVQNHYNLAHRHDDAFVDELAGKGIAYVPFFPLGGFKPLQSATLAKVAASLKATPMQVALAWLLHRSPNILLIPGTCSLEHLRENVAAATLSLTPAVMSELGKISRP
jgi:aryl-alcohol dehydrogenase-like predicted oxidoreductase